MQFIELDLIKGKTFSSDITVTDNSGNLFNFSGLDVRASIRNNYEDGLTGVLEASVIEDGKIRLEIDATGSTGFAVGRMVCDLEAFSSGDASVISVLPLVRLNIWPEVSKSY